MSRDLEDLEDLFRGAVPPPEPAKVFTGDSLADREAKRAREALAAIGWLVYTVEDQLQREGMLRHSDVKKLLLDVRRQLGRGIPFPEGFHRAHASLKQRARFAKPPGEADFLSALDELDGPLEDDSGPLKPEDIPFMFRNRF